METQLFQMIGLYFLYYIGIPGLIILTIWKIKKKTDFIKGFVIFGEKRIDRYSPLLKKHNKDLQNLQILLVIMILISMPLLNLTFYGLQDISMHRSRSYLSGETVFPGHIDRVGGKIGPSFDTDDVIEQMETDRYIDWYLGDIREQIDLDELDRFPGRITVYQIRRTMSGPEKIVVVYSYLSPVPITRSIQFIVLQEKAFLEADTTVVYPMPPSIAAPS